MVWRACDVWRDIHTCAGRVSRSYTKIFVNTEKYFDQEDDLAAVTVELGR